MMKKPQTLKKRLSKIKDPQYYADTLVCADNDIANKLGEYFGYKGWPKNINVAYDYICEEIYGEGYTESLTGRKLYHNIIKEEEVD